jgi:proteic killer suppression protein
MKRSEVIISKKALKELDKLPKSIVQSLMSWIISVESEGIAEIRKIAGYHDELLRGDRAGQRSIRLNKAYRAFYKISDDGEVELVEVIEVNKHKY